MKTTNNTDDRKAPIFLVEGIRTHSPMVISILMSPRARNGIAVEANNLYLFNRNKKLLNDNSLLNPATKKAMLKIAIDK